MAELMTVEEVTRYSRVTQKINTDYSNEVKSQLSRLVVSGDLMELKLMSS